MTETYARTLVTVQMESTDIERDWLSHTVYHHHSDVIGPLTPFDPAGHATNVVNAFTHGTGTGAMFSQYQTCKITARVYNMSDAKPRPVLAEYTYTPTTFGGVSRGPREVAVALRYYGDRNLVGTRGRLFIGNVLMSQLGETVGSVLRSQLLNLGTALGAIGSVETSWVLASTKGIPIGTTGYVWHDIKNIWVNDLWQHMDSREQAEGARSTGTVTPGIP